VAIAVLLLWLCTAGVGTYLLISGLHAGHSAPETAEPVHVPAEQPAAEPVTVPARPLTGRTNDPWDPPSLRQAKSEPLPGLRDLAEFAHPALAMIGFGFWLGYVISRDRIMLAIALGIMLGAICAGVGWFNLNKRDAKRAAAAAASAAGSAGDPGTPDHGPAPLSFPPRLLALHVAGAALTLLIAVLITVRV
jgi:flagellar basal body-associated protein FliL